ncbi:non-homologous end-joining DNA ligase [Ruminiclostridium cellobioparum]|jgi:bifunctional non-homologous end joining protein LigD|uniref:Putative eukaryotic-type DNA primase n=1 Tax=Ruminiclostridium cellobioparum subsp. termitidis CT1112 TaxID=1195236 RepID=S0FPC5_RUMCE|nr:non-homologous end-joining DNA ligase [Ruminiclostridium cellobioparum]EMS70994.1 putative eukaryotic-type DNA primase [Ruminiclostridium cellobioparum subsp. termitidis CT1112]
METITDIKVEIEGKIINVKSPDKLYWPEANVTKLEFIETMTKLAPYVVRHAKNRMLTSIRYPHGIGDKSFFQKEKPVNTPEWVKTVKFNDKNYIALNSAATLVWLCTQAALELHTSFNVHEKPDHPSSLVFDLDPDEGNTFNDVTEIAGSIHETLLALGIKAFIKTSGATGLQIFIPTGARYDYDTARMLNEFFAEYFTHKLSSKVTIERMKKNREGKLYFDWQQMWHGKSMITAYSARAVKSAAVSTPIEWSELGRIRPEMFTLKNIAARVEQKGDLFEPMLRCDNKNQLDEILKQLKK